MKKALSFALFLALLIGFGANCGYAFDRVVLFESFTSTT